MKCNKKGFQWRHHDIYIYYLLHVEIEFVESISLRTIAVSERDAAAAASCIARMLKYLLYNIIYIHLLVWLRRSQSQAFDRLCIFVDERVELQSYGEKLKK